ncbi:MAG: hypothetical protein LBB93_06630 [Elusimicrobiota bacterium]|jgi:hypothetical protein|nr:hypothetical protein [Elusimicrobiota bacterium]
MKKYIKILSTIFFFVSITCLLFPTQYLYTKTNQDLTTLVVEKTKKDIKNAIPAIEQNIKDEDEIGMIINVATLAKNNNLASVFILDNNQNLIATSTTKDRLDIENRAALYENSISKRVETIQTITEGETGMLYSIPLDPERTLFAEISLNDVASMTKKWRNFYYFPFAAMIALVLSVFLYLFARLLTSIPYNKLKKSADKQIKALQKELGKDGENEEILPPPEYESDPETSRPQNIDIKNADLDIFLKENNKKAETINVLENNKKSLSELLKFCLFNYTKNSAIYIVLNSSDQLVFAIDRTRKILKSNIADETSIADAVLDSEFLRFIAIAKEEPNTKLKYIIDDMIELNFYALFVKGQEIGIIVDGDEIQEE